MVGVVAGSFDPFTMGHKELVKEALTIFPSVKILIAINDDKRYTFTLEERIAIIQTSCKDLPVTIELCDGLLPHFIKDDEVLVRGIRTATDLEMEQTLKFGYDSISGGKMKIIYLMPMNAHHRTSSTLVRTLLKHNSPAFKEHVAPEACDLIEYWYKKKIL